VGPLASLLAGQYAGIDQDLGGGATPWAGTDQPVGQLADARLGVRMGSDERDQPEPHRISQRLEPGGQSIRLYWLNDLAYEQQSVNNCGSVLVGVAVVATELS
jgi:hypothetical protein